MFWEDRPSHGQLHTAKCAKCGFSAVALRGGVGWAMESGKSYIADQMRRHSFACSGRDPRDPGKHEWSWVTGPQAS